MLNQATPKIVPDEEGFTLLEVLVAAAVSSVIGLAIAALLTNLSASSASLKAHADFANLQNTLTLLASNSATCASAFQTSAGTPSLAVPLTVNLTNLPTSYTSIQTCTGAACGVAVPQLVLTTGVLLTGPATEGALGASYTGSTPVGPSSLTIQDLRISDLVGTPPGGPGGTALVHLHIGAYTAVGATGSLGVGNNYLTASIPIQLTTDATNHITGCAAGSTSAPETMNAATGHTYGNIYQNTSASPIRVVVTGQLNIGNGTGQTVSVEALVGATSPPAIVVSAASTTNGSGFNNVSFNVLPSYYYEVIASSGGVNLGGGDSTSPTLVSWVEWTN